MCDSAPLPKRSFFSMPPSCFDCSPMNWVELSEVQQATLLETILNLPVGSISEFVTALSGDETIGLGWITWSLWLLEL